MFMVAFVHRVFGNKGRTDLAPDSTILYGGHSSSAVAVGMHHFVK
jgi:hypothetical protein